MKGDRREFLRNSSLALAGLGLASSVPLELIARQRKSFSANGKIGVGVIGVNGMGWADFTSLLKLPDTVPVAICDVDENVLNYRKYELAKNGTQVTTYVDYRKLLENKDIDVVVIGTPDHWHCLQMVEACHAGKDVYVEKPVGNSIQECNAMAAAQEKYSRAVQVGQWQRSQPHMVDALEYLKTGKLGNIRTVKAWAYQGWMSNIPKKPDAPTPAGVHYDMWLGPATSRPFNPNRFHFSFRWFWDYAGGLMTDWGVHLIDYALLGMNAKYPKSVVATGGKFANPDGPEETPDTLAAIYEFDNYNMIWEHAQGIDLGPYKRDHGISYIGNNGTLVLDRGGWEVLDERGRVEPLPVQRNKGNGLDLHTKNFIDVVKSRKMADLHCPIQAGVHVATVCQMGNISYKTGSKVSWNTAQGKFNEAAANPLINATYHNGYKVPMG